VFSVNYILKNEQLMLFNCRANFFLLLGKIRVSVQEVHSLVSLKMFFNSVQ
jgi:hypothetical protein